MRGRPPFDTQLKARRTIDELRLDDPSLRESRLAVMDEIYRRFFDEDEVIALIRFDMRLQGFPTTVEAMKHALG